MNNRADVGVIGMAVMGQNLALNMESRGYRVSVFNRTPEKTDEFIKEKGPGKNLFPFHNLEEFVDSLKSPRKILIMVKAGKPVDDTINQLTDFLEKGDLIMDGGNSHYADTERRFEYLKRQNILFLGVGVSGGEEGALNGPSLMPGGSMEAYREAEKILTDISAKTDGSPCCAYMGPGGAGHFVKMVHNGIEYADMQLIAETFHYLRKSLNLSVDKIREIFRVWNQGPLNSYLIEITEKILAARDDDGTTPLIDVISDKAGQKGTGRWTSITALEMGAPLSIIDAALFARNISAMKDQRVEASKILEGPSESTGDFSEDLIKYAEESLMASKIASYAQGMAFLRTASDIKGYGLNLSAAARIWRGGCIIRARILESIKKAYEDKPDLNNLFLHGEFREIISKSQKGWRKTVARCAEEGIPCPALSAALAYYDSYRCSRLPADLIQAQRDFFGAHTYERLDREGSFHTSWI